MNLSRPMSGIRPAGFSTAVGQYIGKSVAELEAYAAHVAAGAYATALEHDEDDEYDKAMAEKRRAA